MLRRAAPQLLLWRNLNLGSRLLLLELLLEGSALLLVCSQLPLLLEALLVACLVHEEGPQTVRVGLPGFEVLVKDL